LRFALAAAAGNLILAGAIRWLGARRSLDIPKELPIFAGVWYLVILPIALVAGFSLGRAGRMPGRPGKAIPDPDARCPIIRFRWQRRLRGNN
jgi:hypothetical protein